MPFPYYANLSARDKRTYRKSDQIQVVKLPPRPTYSAAVLTLERALVAERRTAVQQAADQLCLEMTRALRVEPIRVKVLAVRPSYRDGSELHGMYTAEDGKRPVIEVWMRTARHKRVVAFRTFLRTLLHEVVHHLDFTLHGLPESFHTEGFFKRESSLFKQIVPAELAARAAKKPKAKPKAAAKPEGSTKPKAKAATKPKAAAKPPPRAAAKTKNKPTGGTKPKKKREQLELPF